MQYRAKRELPVMSAAMSGCWSKSKSCDSRYLDTLQNPFGQTSRSLDSRILCTDGSQVTAETKFLCSEEGKAP